MKRKRLPEDVHDYFVRMGRVGGLKGAAARIEKISAERRKEIARQAIGARWAKTREKDETRGLPFKNDFFASKTIVQLIAEQKADPVGDISSLTGAIPDEDLDDFIADIYKDRRTA
jgi:hypothetical protein